MCDVAIISTKRSHQMSSPQKYTIKVLGVRDLGDGFWSGKFEKPIGFDFQAGQYISILVDRDGGQRRSYSIASSPEQSDLELAVDTAPMGVGSRYLLALKPGDEIEILGPLGRFTVVESSKNKVFLGTGCGVVPLRSQVRDLLVNKGFKGRIELQWGMRTEKNSFWKVEFEELQRQFPNFHFDLVLSRSDLSWLGCKGHVQDCLLKHGLDFNEWEAYLCGNSVMMADVTEKLAERGVSKEEIFQERFN